MKKEKLVKGSIILSVSAIVVGCIISTMFLTWVIIVGLALLSLFFLVLGVKELYNQQYEGGVFCLSLSGIFLACEGNPLKDMFNLPQLVPDACAWLILISWLGLLYVLLADIGIFSSSAGD